VVLNYSISNAAASVSARVTVTVTAVNDAPIANPDIYTTLQNTPLSVPAPGVLNNDSDAEGTSITAALVTTTTHGSLTLNVNGSFTYTPDTN